MNRRDVLASTGLVCAAALAGCLSEGNDSGDGSSDDTPTPDDATGSDDTNTDDDTDDDRSTDVFERHIRLENVDGVPESVPVEFDATVAESTIGTQGSALLELTATNTDNTEREVPTPFYKGPSEGERRLVLYSLEAPDSPTKEYVPECIADPEPRDTPLEWTDEGPLTHGLEPGETGSDELLLVDDHTAEGCFPPGEYRFERSHAIDGTEFAWGFTVVVSEDPSPGEVEDRRYEECPREIIPYDQFPTDVQAEIDAALDGSYEADRVFLREAMDPDRSFVSVDNEYYNPTVTVEDGAERLELTLVEPKVLPRDRPVNVTLERGTERTVTIELVADDGTVLVDTTRSIYAGGDIEFGRTNRVGTHELRVTVADGEDIESETTHEVRVSESQFSVIVIVEEDDITTSGAVADLGICQYESQ